MRSPLLALPNGARVRHPKASNFNSGQIVRLRSVLPLVAIAATTASVLTAQSSSIDPAMYSSLRYRLIGPFRGGRTVGAAGIPDQPNTFYVGVSNGGV
jgi:hypothetical protein